jgi:hypothetical protein
MSTPSEQRRTNSIRRSASGIVPIQKTTSSVSDADGWTSAAGLMSCPEKGVDIDLVNQSIGTVGEDDWMAEMMLNMMMVFADAERKMIRSRVQEGIDAAIANGKRVGRPPYGYTVEDGFLKQLPEQYVRVQNFIREVRKGREKKATAAFFDIPESKIRSILERAETNYDIPFHNNQWRVERAKVDAGEKELPPLDAQSGHPPAPTRGPEQ